uniref:Prolyl endopeptidase n=1 Tax=Kalanchoe fedtschenkoi TaxID=63787 RepID=A0A7N0RA53_KALFE
MGSLSHIAEPLQYPVVRRDESVADDYHGVLVPDPYRWLEDPDSEEVKEFVQKQVKLTDKVLATCELREKLRKKITASYDHPRYGLPFRRADRYFYFHNSGLQAQSVLYTQDSLDGAPKVLLDPNGLSADGTISLSRFAISPDAEYLAYGLSSSGSDWVTIQVTRIQDRRVEADTLSWVKFSSIAWTHDSKGFFYSRFPAPEASDHLDAGTETDANLYHELYYHVLGTDQSEDILCWKDPENPKHRFQAEVTEDGKYVIICVEEGCDPVNKLYYLDISTQALEPFKRRTDLPPFVKLVHTFDARYHVVANDGTAFTFLSNKDAPRYKLVRVDLKEPDVWTDVVPESDRDVLEFARAVNGEQVILSYLSDVKSVLQVRDLRTGSLLRSLKIDVGSVYGISARRGDSFAFISFTSFLSPGIIYLCDLSNEAPDMKVYRESLVPGFDRSEFKAQQVFVRSRDGTRIPIFIVGKKNMALDRSHPCLLYGYGGFDYKLSPHFKASNIALMKHLDAVFCMSNVRGGGEYGTEWHKAGSMANKQNCFDDFIAAAEYLISAGYTQPRKICIEGASNGGLLVGACMNQRPDLFGCALAHVGVMDMLRFHKFTIGQSHMFFSSYLFVTTWDVVRLPKLVLQAMHGRPSMAAPTRRKSSSG